MASQLLFADAFYWVALVSPRDAHHARVVAFSRTLGTCRLLTTDEVLNEVLTHFSRSGSYWRAKAARFIHQLRSGPGIDVLPQTRDSFDTALALFEARLDKAYSLTDCRSMGVMRVHGISEVLTNDHHFGQEGFTVLFP